MHPIQGYEEQYVISSCGAVTRIETGRVLRPSVNPQNGYLYVGLWKNGEGKTFSVHRLVATHFTPNPKNLPTVNHKNSVRTEPDHKNLEWCTQSENLLHGYEFGFMSQEHRRHYKDFELDLLIGAFLTGVSITEIALECNVGLSRLSINMRKRAETNGQYDEYLKELHRQKTLRNTAANAGKKIRIVQLTLCGKYVAEHASLTDAAKAIGAKSSGSISNCLKPDFPQKTAGGFTWKYA